VLAGAAGVATHRWRHAVEGDEHLMDGAGSVVLVDRQGLLHQRPHHREVGDQIRLIDPDGDGRAPRRAQPVELVDVVLGGAERGRRVGGQRRAQARPLQLDASHAVVAAPQIETPGPRLEPFALLVVGRLERFGVELDEGVGVRREARTGGEQHALVIGRGLQQALDRLQREGQRGANELRVVVGGVHGRARGRQRVAQLVDRKGLDGAGRQDRGGAGGQQDQPDP
jgi:hypothetical protein